MKTNYYLPVFLLLAIVVLTFFLWDAVYPFIIGIVLSFILNPAVKFIENHKIKSPYSIIIVIILFILFILVFFIFIAPVILSQSYNLMMNLKDYFRESEKLLNNLVKYLINAGFPINKQQVISNIAENLNSLISPFFNSTVTYLLNSLQDIVKNIILVPLTIFYVLKDKVKILTFLNKYLTEKNREKFQQVYSFIVIKLRAYLKSIVIVSLLITTIMTLLLFFWGVKHFITLGIFAGAVSIIPYLGFLLQVLFIAIVQLSTGDSLSSIFWLFIIQLIFNVLIAFIIQPKITNISLRIHPLLFILSIIIGGYTYGVLGMLFSIPAFIITQTVFEYLLKKYEKN